MPMRFLLMSVFALMLLPFPLEAKEVYVALAAKEITAGYTEDFDSLDHVVKNGDGSDSINSNKIDYYFQKWRFNSSTK
jgi:hypothetical protein